MTEWKNRITGYGTEAPDQLLANPHNHRIHPRRQQDALSGSLDTLGYIQTVIVNKTTGRMIDGHLRVSMALREGQKEIPVTYVELTESEEAQALLSLDPIAAMAASDADKVDELLRMIQTDDERVMQHLADLAKENGLDYGQTEQGDAPAEVDRAAELLEKWGVRLGDVWGIGEHRLICGDCTDAMVVEKVMQGERAQLITTSPPYGVGMEYEGEPDYEATIKLLQGAFGATCPHVLDSGFAFVNFGERYIWPKPMVSTYFDIFIGLGWRWYDQRFWKRSSVGMAIWNTTQPRAMSQVEYLFTFQNGNKAYPVHDLDISKSQLWEDEGSSAGMNHPAVMALGVSEKSIKIYTAEGDTIIEPFAGSGTSIVACENLRRKCRAIELDPKYIAVALERMSQAFPSLEIRRLSESSR